MSTGSDGTEGGMSGNRWSFLAVTCAALVLSLSTWFSATAVMPELILRWGLGASEAAWLTNGVQAGFVAGALISSALALPDRLHPNRLMGAAATVAGLATLLLLLEPGPAAAIAARMLTGAALACVYPPAIRLMATWFRQGRGLALGCLIGALTLGSALPHLVRGLGEALDWRLVIGAAGLFSLPGRADLRAGAARGAASVRPGRRHRPPPDLRRPAQPPGDGREPRLFRPHVGALCRLGLVSRLGPRGVGGGAGARQPLAPDLRRGRRGRARLRAGRDPLGPHRALPHDGARHGDLGQLCAGGGARLERARLAPSWGWPFSGGSRSWPTARSSRLR